MSSSKFVNLTPHVINIINPSGQMDLPPSGVVARVATTTAVVDEIDGVEIIETSFGKLEALPPPQEGVYYIVSRIVLEAARRGDLLSPGPLVRGPTGQPIGCKGLSR